MSQPEQSTLSPTLLTKAALRAAEHLGLAADLPSLLQVEPAVATSLQSGERLLDPQWPEWQRAQRLVAVFRALVTLLGDTKRAQAWLAAPNEHLRSAPIDLLRSPDDERLMRYLNAVQKHELNLPPGTAFRTSM